MSYINPVSVISPKDRLHNLQVIHDQGAGAWSLARFQWEGREGCLGLRWNGDERSGVGSPQSRGVPTWFMVPEELTEAILKEAEKIKARAQSDLMAGYAEMAADSAREQEAQEWSENLLKDAADETR